MTARDIMLRPHVAWPRSMTAGRKYLVTVDLEHLNSETWAYDEEDCPITCVLSGSGPLAVRVVDSPTVILHRFGGTYGPARFVVESAAALPATGAALTLTLVTAGGMPIRSDVLPITARPAPGDEDEEDLETVTIALPEIVEVEVEDEDDFGHEDTVIEPEPGSCCAVLLGISEFDHYPNLPAVPAVLARLGNTLLDTETGDGENWHVFTHHEPDVNECFRAIQAACEQPTETLLVYFAGHAHLYFGEELWLPVRSTEIGDTSNAISATALLNLVSASPACHVVVVFEFADHRRIRWFWPRGVFGRVRFLLSELHPDATRARSDSVSRFTQVVCDGIENGPEWLSISDIQAAMKHRIDLYGLATSAVLSLERSSDPAFLENRTWSSGGSSQSRTSGLQEERVVRILATGGQSFTVASGYLATRETVMTSAVAIAGADNVEVYLPATDSGEERHCPAHVAWSDPTVDVAILYVMLDSDDVRRPRRLSPARFGLATDPAYGVAVGYFGPFEPTRSGVSTRGPMRIEGSITVQPTRRGFDLRLTVDTSRLPGAAKGGWGAMMGAPLWSGGCLVGVINGELKLGTSRVLSAVPIQQWYGLLGSMGIEELHELIGLPTAVDELGIPTYAPDESPHALSTLPPHLPGFTGRSAEVDELRAIQAAHKPGNRSDPLVCMIDGMPGVGKTALAVHVARLLADRYPDGQLFLSMRVGGEPLAVTDATAYLLMSVGLNPHQIPDDPSSRSALWRLLTADKRMLLVLDDVVNFDQVQPLLPMQSQSLVLVTSRRRFAGLVAPEWSERIHLDVPSANEAAGMFERLLGHDELSLDRVELLRAAELCGNLPLAMSIIADRVRRDPDRTVNDIERLADGGQDRLAAFEGGGGASVASAIETSYRELSASSARLFRLLGAQPGVDVTPDAAACLLDLPVETARSLLVDLVSYNLINEVAHHRYEMHDLVRRFARRESTDETSEAIERLLDYYELTVRTADAAIGRFPKRTTASSGRSLSAGMVGMSHDEGLAWLRTERPNFLACLDYAVKHRLDGRFVALCDAGANFIRVDGPWQTARDLLKRAMVSAANLHDPLAEADAMANLGSLLSELGELRRADLHLDKAATIYEARGVELGVSSTTVQLGVVAQRLGAYPTALRHLIHAAVRYKEQESALGQASALTELGVLHEHMGEFAEALRWLQSAVAIFADLAHSLGHADALTRLGAVRLVVGQFDAAAADLRRALAEQRQLNNNIGIARVLIQLGHLSHLLGDYSDANGHLDQAFQILTQVNHPRNIDVVLRLGALWYAMQNYAGALEILQPVMDSTSEIGPFERAEATSLSALVLQATGGLEVAERRQLRALELYRQIGARGGEAVVLSRHGSVLLERGKLPAADEAYQKSLRLARVIGLKDCEALALEGVARCLVRGSRSQEAAATMHQALDIYRGLGMRAHVERLERELAQLE